MLSDAMASVINLTGIVRANSLVERNGEIHLSGGTRGVVALDGARLEAAGNVAGTSGGSVHVLGDKIGLFGTTRIDASGDAGGGAINVGGSFQGQGPLANASMVYVGPDAVIDASARTRGDGGTAIVWSDHATRFFGAIDSRGGTRGGDGGLVEVSGRDHLDFQGTSDRSAPNGTAGTLLLDPTNITIDNSGADVRMTGASPFAPSATGGSVLRWSTILGALGSASSPGRCSRCRPAALRPPRRAKA